MEYVHYGSGWLRSASLRSVVVDAPETRRGIKVVECTTDLEAVDHSFWFENDCACFATHVDGNGILKALSLWLPFQRVLFE